MPESVHLEKLDSLSTLDCASNGLPSHQPNSENEGVRSPARRAALSLSLSTAACGAALLWFDRSAQAAPLQHPDIKALRFLEELEELQTDFFTRSTTSSGNAGLTSRDREILSILARQDSDQAAWLALARGRYGVATGFYLPNASQSRPPRTFNFGAADFVKRDQILEMAATIKEPAVGAYHGLMLKVEEPRLAQSLAALAGVEARHAAALQTIGRTGIQPAAMELPLSASQVMEKLREFGFRGEALQ